MKKILIILGLTIGIVLNAQFTYYDDPSSGQPTTQELISSLTSQQRAALVDAFAEGKSPTWLSKNEGVSAIVTSYFYAFFRQMATRADSLMEENNYTSSQLLAAVYAEYISDFTESQVQYILSKRIEYSKNDGSGDWNYYKSQFE